MDWVYKKYVFKCRFISVYSVMWTYQCRFLKALDCTGICMQPELEGGGQMDVGFVVCQAVSQQKCDFSLSSVNSI